MKRLIPILLFGTSFFSCIPETDFTLPENQEIFIKTMSNSDIQAVISAYQQTGEETYTFPEEESLFVEGVVISSDEAGNFYKTLIVQNSFKDGPLGLAIKINLRAYYTFYQKGSKVLVKISGLSMTRTNGSYTLGFRRNGRLEEIPEGLLNTHIIRTMQPGEATAELIDASSISNRRLNTMIRLENVQFEKEDLGKTFAGEAYDAYNALRPLVNCESLSLLQLSTSIYSDFKSALLPQGTFDLEGVLIREYSGEMAIVLNSPEAIQEKENPRCDPEYLYCNSPDNKPNKKRVEIFYDDFDQIGSTREIPNYGWINLNRNYGNGKFVKRSSNDNTFLQVSAYGTGEELMDAWLISPSIDLNNWEYKELTFKTRATFNKGRLLTVWLCEEIEADFDSTQWKQLDVKISDGSTDGSNEGFTNSGPVNLDCFEGEVRIGFRYMGGDPSPSTTYDLDNFLITGLIQESN